MHRLKIKELRKIDYDIHSKIDTSNSGSKMAIALIVATFIIFMYSAATLLLSNSVLVDSTLDRYNRMYIGYQLVDDAISVYKATGEVREVYYDTKLNEVSFEDSNIQYTLDYCIDDNILEICFNDIDIGCIVSREVIRIGEAYE